MKPIIDPQLLQWATVRQLEYVEAIEKHGSMRAAAKAIGSSKSSIQDSMRSLRARAAKQGYSPRHDMDKIVPDGFKVKGVSTYYNKDGQKTAQWVKSSEDRERLDALMREAAAAMAEELPRLLPVAEPIDTHQHLCNVYTITDAHVGALAWHREGGADWDLKIAEKTLTGCFAQMLASSPAAESCVVAQLGDYLHTDTLLPLTPTSSNVLDSDGRFAKVAQIAIRILRNVVDMALSKHSRVVVLMGEGNHDPASSVWLRAMFRALYEKESRITVIDSELPYYVYQHGNTMLAWHHGHLKKPDELPILFAAQFPKVWGATTKRYAHCGHRHHVDEKEHSGITVIQHPTLTARDAYAARGGWISERQVTSITYHSKFGQVARNTVVPEMLDQ